MHIPSSFGISFDTHRIGNVDDIAHIDIYIALNEIIPDHIYLIGSEIARVVHTDAQTMKLLGSDLPLIDEGHDDRGFFIQAVIGAESALGLDIIEQPEFPEFVTGLVRTVSGKPVGKVVIIYFFQSNLHLRSQEHRNILQSFFGGFNGIDRKRRVLDGRNILMIVGGIDPGPEVFQKRLHARGERGRFRRQTTIIGKQLR